MKSLSLIFGVFIAYFIKESYLSREYFTYILNNDHSSRSIKSSTTKIYSGDFWQRILSIRPNSVMLFPLGATSNSSNSGSNHYNSSDHSNSTNHTNSTDHTDDHIATDDHHSSTDDHHSSTDDHHSGNSTHSSDHSGGHQLFNALMSIEILIGSCSILLIISFVLTVEFFFEKLNEATEDTPFEELLRAIEKELMIVGTMAFIFKTILSIDLLKDEAWIFALEYADTLVPITAFMFCIEGIFLILMSVRQCEVWSKSYQCSLTHLFDDYFDNHVQTYVK